MTLTSIGPANRMARSAETHPLTWRLREDAQPVWLEEYQSKDGYAAARKALTQMAQDDIVQTVKDSGLKGRGGAGFPTGVKWGLMPKDESLNIRYLLCNADEMEPNTWKDRMLMEQLPHLLVEGMLISARALKAYRGYIFLRGEYVDAARNLNRAIECYRTRLSPGGRAGTSRWWSVSIGSAANWCCARASPGAGLPTSPASSRPGSVRGAGRC